MAYTEKMAAKKLKVKAVVLRIWPATFLEDRTLVLYMWRQANGPRAVPARM